MFSMQIMTLGNRCKPTTAQKEPEGYRISTAQYTNVNFNNRNNWFYKEVDEINFLRLIYNKTAPCANSYGTSALADQNT